MKILSSPLAKTVLTIVAVIVVLRMTSKWTSKIPVVGQYLA
jgi:hypothetical protein